MNTFSRTALTNLGILILYAGFLHIVMPNSDDLGIGLGIYTMIAVGAQILINLVASILFFATKQKDRAKAFLASTLLIAVIGPSVCLGSLGIG